MSTPPPDPTPGADDRHLRLIDTPADGTDTEQAAVDEQGAARAADPMPEDPAPEEMEADLGRIAIELNGDAKTGEATRRVIYGAAVVDISSDVDLMAYILAMAGASRAAEHEWGLYTMLRRVNPTASEQHLGHEVGQIQKRRQSEWVLGDIHITTAHAATPEHDPLVIVTDRATPRPEGDPNAPSSVEWWLSPEDVQNHLAQLIDAVVTVPLDMAYGNHLTSTEIGLTEERAEQALRYLHHTMWERRAALSVADIPEDLAVPAVNTTITDNPGDPARG